MKLQNCLVSLLIAPIAACNIVPRDTTAEQEAQIREHNQVVAEKRAREQSAGMPPEEVALLQQNDAQVRKEKVERAAFAERVHQESTQNRDLATWRRGWSAECALRLSYSTCSQAPALATQDDKARCDAECDSAIQESIKRRLEDSLTACAIADGEAKCELEFLQTATRRDGTPIPSEGIGEALAACSKECSSKRSEIAIDVVERPKAASSGESLVLSYKRCMLTVDSTRQAVTYRIHDTELYQDLMEKADARCRAASKCDWLEKYSDDWRCYYGN